jgi:peptidoglycan-associated lipoprotein
MTRITVVSAALLLGLGCSHATPKPDRPAQFAAAPRPVPPAPQLPQEDWQSPTAQQARNDSGEAIYFDFDSALIREDAGPTLQEVGKELAYNHRKVRIEGNCDERGTTEYNIALGDRRAREAKLYLERLGVPDSRISVVSYGSERPKDPGHNEHAWTENRRDDFRVQ